MSTPKALVGQVARAAEAHYRCGIVEPAVAK